MTFRMKWNPYKKFEAGDFYIGLGPEGDVGIRTETHAITVAGNGAGKTSSILIPNARLWPQNLFAVDIKGDIVKNVWQAREAMGQRVVVVDPFKMADVPDRLRMNFNPLEHIDPEAESLMEDLLPIARGLVHRHDPKHGYWDEGTESLLLGIMAYTKDTWPEAGDLSLVRKALVRPDFDTKFLDRLEEKEGLCGLPQAAASLMRSGAKDAGHYKGGALSNTRWLDSPYLSRVLGGQGFDMGALRDEKVDVFLVLPFDELENHKRFLRLAVSCALRAMTSRKGSTRRTLFLLDEFFALGMMPDVRTGLVVARSFGVQFWFYLQNMGQLEELYGKAGAQSFWANCNVHMFFGPEDDETLAHVSKRLGEITIEDIDVDVPVMTAPPVDNKTLYTANRMGAQPFHLPSGKHPVLALGWNAVASARAALDNAATAEARAEMDTINRMHQAKQDTERLKYDRAMKEHGKARVAPDVVKKTIGKGPGDEVAKAALVFAPGGGVQLVGVEPYWRREKREKREWEETIKVELHNLGIIAQPPIKSDYLRHNRKVADEYFGKKLFLQKWWAWIALFFVARIIANLILSIEGMTTLHEDADYFIAMLVLLIGIYLVRKRVRDSFAEGALEVFNETQAEAAAAAEKLNRVRPEFLAMAARGPGPGQTAKDIPELT